MSLINSTTDLIQRLTRELRSHRRMIDEAGRATRGPVLAEAHAWAAYALKTGEKVAESIAEEFHRVHALWYVDAPADDAAPRVNYYHQRIASAATVGALALCLLEVLFTGGTAYMFLVASPWMAIATGSAVALLIAYGLKGVVVPIAVAPTEITPLRSRKRMIAWLLVSGTIETVLLLMLLTVARSYYSGGEAVSLGLIMALLSVWTPVVTGLLFALANLYGWSTALPRDYWEVQQLLGGIRDLHESCERELNRTLEQCPTLAAVTNVVLVLMLLALGPASQALAATAGGAGATPCEGEIWDDGTKSVLQTDRIQTKQDILNSIAGGSWPCPSMHWKFYRFGALSWTERPKAAITVATWAEPACDAPVLSEASKLFRSARDTANKRAEEQCRARRDSAKRAYEQSLRSALDGVRRAWASDSTVFDDDCTSLHDAATRVASYPRRVYAVFVTDGVDTCSTLHGPIEAPAAGSSLVVVLLATAGNGRQGGLARDYAERRANLQTMIPWARIIAPWELGAGLFLPAGPR